MRPGITEALRHMLAGIPAPQLGVLFALSRGYGRPKDIAWDARQSQRLAAVNLRRVVARQLATKQGRGAYAVHPGAERAIHLGTRGEGLFWWESNRLWGMVQHPLHWLFILHCHPNDDRALAMRAKRCQDGRSFGLRGEHRGETLYEWARREGIDWVWRTAPVDHGAAAG
jgi:hypothetical protein